MIAAQRTNNNTTIDGRLDTCRDTHTYTNTDDPVLFLLFGLWRKFFILFSLSTQSKKKFTKHTSSSYRAGCNSAF